ncbi:hypothetical protein AB0M46_30530 [Dactylosporangium sp. NPDC051485]|uniref:hypothetical protein n=1 Tax=Dactylosporangium sp. NPDC051485 TaxID=3154846 RepID=UPI0034211622
MNTWFRRTVGTVGLAGGMLLLGAGAAHADDTALAAGQLDDLFSPLGGPNNQSLQLQAHSDRIDTSVDAATDASLETNRLNGRPMPGVLDGVPVSSLVPTDSLGLPRTTSSRLPGLPALPTGAVPVAGTESSLPGLPLVGQLTSLDQVGLPGLPGTGTLGGTSIADTSTALPALPATRSKPKPSPRGAQTEDLPLVGSLPLLGDGLPIRGTLKPVNDYAIPVGYTESGGLPLVGDAPLGGSDVLKNDSITGLPVIGGIGPTPGVSTTAVANRLVPTTGALPQAAGRLPLVTESAYRPRHAQPEALPLVTGLPAVGGIAGGVLPLFSGIVG